MTRYVAYLRDSGGDRQNLSTERQESMLRQWAADNGHTIGKVFVDQARSGSSTVGRSAFLEMVRYLDGKTPEQGLLLWEISRLSRDYNDAQFYLAAIRKNGYEVTSIADQIPDGPIGKLIESITIWSAEDERARMRERVKSGLQYLVHVKKCWPMGAPPPVGYKTEPVNLGMRRDGRPHIGRRVVVDPDAAPLVRQAFEMRAAGYSNAEIHAATKICKRPTSYHAVFSNRFYLGEFRYGEGVSEDFCEPIIERELFDAVQAVIEDWKERLGFTSPRGATSYFLLSGLVKCNICGRQLIGRRNEARNKAFYICIKKSHPLDEEERCTSHAVHAKRLEKMVLDRVVDLLDNPQVLYDLQVAISQKNASQDTDRQDKLADARRDLAANARQQANIALAIREAGHSKVLLAELKNLEAEEAELLTKIEHLERAKPAPVVIPDLAQLSKTIRQAIEQADRRKLQLLLREIIVEIYVEKEAKRRGAITGRLHYSLGVDNWCSLD